MSKAELFKRIVVASVVAALWSGAVYFWYWRSFYVFHTDPCRLPTNLTVPTDMVVSDPEPERDCGKAMFEDSSLCDDYARTLFRAACATSSLTTVVCDITALDQLNLKNPELLHRYFAANPAWMLMEDESGCIAVRRYRWTDGYWHNPSSGLCGDFDPPDLKESLKHFESYTAVLLEDAQWDVDGIDCRSGERVNIETNAWEDDEREIDLVCKGETLSLNVMEYGPCCTCRLMQAAFDFTENEFYRLAIAGDWARAKDLLPAGSIKRGPPELRIFRDLAGRYRLETWVNPGEKGKIRLKGFEVTKEIPLTIRGNRTFQAEYIGWSEDSEEKFYANFRFGFHEYSETNDFAVRFEIWFAPANGGPERKLVERVFRVKGKER